MRIALALVVIVLAARAHCDAATQPLVARSELVRSPATGPNARLGNAVAMSGDTVVVGAQNDAGPGPHSGAAYVLIRDGGAWTVQAKLEASDADAGDLFGDSVAIDGDTIVVGAESHDDVGVASGAAYVFVRTGTVWTEQAKLTATDAAEGDFFGVSVGVSGDTIVVGAFYDQDAGFASGAAYVFDRSGTTWSQSAKLKSADLEADDYFGYSVAIQGDTIAVGVPESDDAGTQSGSAYVFVRSAGVWGEQAKLTAANASAEKFFGAAVALSDETVVVGSQPLFFASGAAYVFVRSAGTWSQQAELRSPSRDSSDGFGTGVVITQDTIVVGARGTDTDAANAGAVYLFGRSAGTWSLQGAVSAAAGVDSGFFGYDAAVEDSTLIVGAPADFGKPDRGHVYVYDLAAGVNTGGSLAITSPEPTKTRLSYRARSTSLLPMDAGPGGDPRCAYSTGASFEVKSATSGHTFSQLLPCARWTAGGDPLHPRDYVYKDPDRTVGPCTRAKLRKGALKIDCSARPTSPLSYLLQVGQSETPVSAILTVGSTTYCARFGGTVTQDGTDGRRFSSRRASTASACD